MLRKSLHVSIVICLLAAIIMPASVAAAQQPLPPSTPQTGQVQPVDPVKNGGPLPEVVQKAVQLQQSLSPSQQAAIRAVLDQYRPELVDIAAVDTASRDGVAAPNGFKAGVKQPTANLPETTQSEAKRFDGNQAARLTAVLDKIDAGMAGILNADQLSLYRAVVKPDFASSPMTAVPGLTAKPESASPNLLGKPQPAGPNLLSKSDSAPSAPAGYTSNCYYAAYYGAVATYYGYYAYIYSYYEYYYYGNTNGYYAYIYNYYTYYYLKYGLDYSAPLYFLWYYMGIYQSGYPYNSYYNNYYGSYYSYYGYYYAYYEYANTGNTYAYYAYLYSYYAYNYYAYYAYYYAYYCYANS